jgi:hypothetical protein
MTNTLDQSQLSQLAACAAKPGIWRGCDPSLADPELRSWLLAGLVEWADPGYRITDAGKHVLQQYSPRRRAG